MQPDPAARRGSIERALLDYHESPGRFSLARRQPSLLYVAIKDVLQIASGRAPGGRGPTPPPPMQQAACFFIRSALLYPDAPPYAVLGLERTADAAAIKDHYRLMMRLMHPDFAGTTGSAPWPADAATRVNRAYEILSSPDSRAAYDHEVPTAPPAPAAQAGKHTSPGRLAATRGNVAAKRHREDNRRNLKRLSTVFGAVGGAALVAAGVAILQPDRESLVQRRNAGVRQEEPAARAGMDPLPQPQPRIAELAPPPEEATPLPAVAELPAAPPVTSLRTALVQVRPNVPAPAYLPPPAEASTPPATMNAMPAPSAAAQVVAVAAMPAPPPPAPAAQIAPPPVMPAALPSPTLTEVHPMLSRLLQEIESGWGDRVMGLVDREARNTPAGQALLLHYNNLVGGARPVKVSNVQFNAQPRDGRLLVTGRLVMQPYDRAAPPRELAVQAEFAARDGALVMTRLTRAPD